MPRDNQQWMERYIVAIKRQQTRHKFSIRTLATAAFLLLICVLNAQNVIDIPKFHHVSDHIYRGAQPSEQGLQELAKLGIVTILDLRPAEEKDTDEKHEVAKLGMRYVNIPMHGLKSPTREQIEHGLQVLQDPAAWPVYVHCHFGVDRAGTLIACYRIQVESWSNEKAKREAEEIGMHRFESGMKSFILHFQAATAPPQTPDARGGQSLPRN